MACSGVHNVCLQMGLNLQVKDLRHIGTSLGLERLARLCDQLLSWRPWLHVPRDSMSDWEMLVLKISQAGEATILEDTPFSRLSGALYRPNWKDAEMLQPLRAAPRVPQASRNCQWSRKACATPNPSRETYIDTWQVISKSLSHHVTILWETKYSNLLYGTKAQSLMAGDNPVWGCLGQTMCRTVAPCRTLWFFVSSCGTEGFCCDWMLLARQHFLCQLHPLGRQCQLLRLYRSRSIPLDPIGSL